MPEQGHRPTVDLPGIAQVFSAAFTVLIAGVVAATFEGMVVALLTAGAAGGACVAIYLGVGRRPWTRGVLGLFGVASAVAVVFAGGAVAVATGDAPGAPASVTPAEPGVVVAKDGYRLTPSSNPLTNDEDKVDLDTGCPGWGPTSVPIGRDRCGELADLIIESDDLHTYESRPRLALLGAGQDASWATCQRVLAGDTATTGSVRRGELRRGSGLCVRTDKGNVAAVRVVLADGDDVVIDFEVWSED